MKQPARGEVWTAELEPVKGHEQGGRRPVLVVSSDTYNSGPAELVVVIPLTKTNRNIPLHVLTTPPEGGLRVPSSALCDAIRSVSKARIDKRWGWVTPETMNEIDRRIRILLEL